MPEFKTSDVLKMMASASKKPDNRMTLKFKGIILQATSYKRSDDSTAYNYMIWRKESGDVLKFGSARLLKQGEEAEVMITLTGFQAFEAR